MVSSIGRFRVIAFVLGLSTVLAACGGNVQSTSTMTLQPTSTSPPTSTPQSTYTEPSVYFTNIKDGDMVSSPVVLKWSSKNFMIEPAGEVHEGAGHLHLMIDTPCITAGEAIPNPPDNDHRHYRLGSTETEINLSSGEHTLCLQAGDGVHIALLGDGMTDVITINVNEE